MDQEGSEGRVPLLRQSRDTGLDAAGGSSTANYRAQQERAKYDKLIRFGDALPAQREAMALHFEQEEFDRERVSAIR